MYLGIDLGTSNSAVVGHIDGATRLFKTSDGTDVLPSVIYLDKRGHRFIGKSAYDRLLSAPQNVAQGFKRSMGTKNPISFAGQTWTPVECSAEIIKALVGQAMTEAGNQEVEGVVITTPAAFNQMQSEDTIAAARLAGLEKVRLHDLRHTAASIAINEGTSLAIVGRMLGHTQPQTTQRYAHVGKDPALKAVDAVGSAMAATFAESERT